MTLTIKGIVVKQVPLKAKEVQFDKNGKDTTYADKSGKVVVKQQISSASYKWMYEDGSEYAGKSYKMINGKPVKGFKKTSVIDKYETISKANSSYFVSNDHTYLLISKEFKKQMQKLGDKAITFKYAHSGFKVYNAVVSYDEVLDKVLMRCFRGDLRKLELNDDLVDQKEIEVDEVASLDLEELDL